MKKKILFTAYTLDVGGIETSLVDLVNELIKKYEITLVLEKKQGLFLNSLNEKIKVIEYKPNQNKNVVIRKTINVLKRIKFILKHKNKFDFAASFATYSKMGSFCARIASKNNALWVHTDYLAFYNNNEKKMISFFNFIEFNKFKNIICVSENAKNNLEKILKKHNITVINNLIDYETILKKSKEEINLKKDSRITTFLNVSRHDEESKRISRLIDAAERLKKANYDFRILLIGEGKDTSLYKEQVKSKKLESVITFLGEKNNPYPYFKLADAFILTSEYEGYPVIFNEAKILNLPIITTNVSDAKKDIENKFGIVTNKDTNSIYEAMENIIKNGYTMKYEFKVNEFNNSIKTKIDILINGGDNAKN